MKPLKARLVSAGVLVSFCIFVTANPVSAEVSDTHAEKNGYSLRDWESVR
jgi:hypothetical protein